MSENDMAKPNLNPYQLMFVKLEVFYPIKRYGNRMLIGHIRRLSNNLNF